MHVSLFNFSLRTCPPAITGLCSIFHSQFHLICSKAAMKESIKLTVFLSIKFSVHLIIQPSEFIMKNGSESTFSLCISQTELIRSLFSLPEKQIKQPGQWSHTLFSLTLQLPYRITSGCVKSFKKIKKTMITTQLMSTEIVKHSAKVWTFCVVPHMS